MAVVLSILICNGHDAAVTTEWGDDTPAGRGVALLLDYNVVEGTDAALPHFTMGRGIQCGR